MKLTKTSRVTAMILALLMIVPLISVPTFAEDGTATNNLPYTADGKINYLEDFEDEDSNASIIDLNAKNVSVIDTYNNISIVDGATYGGRDGKVLEIKYDADVSTTNIQGAVSPAANYKTDRYITISMDVYVPTGTTAQFEVGMIKLMNHAGDSVVKTANVSLGTIVASGTTLGLKFGNVSESIPGNTSLVSMELDKWNTITSIIDLESAAVSQYINGELKRTFIWQKDGMKGNYYFDANNVMLVKVGSISEKAIIVFDNFKVNSISGGTSDFASFVDPRINAFFLNSNSTATISAGDFFGKDASDKVLAVNIAAAISNDGNKPITIEPTLSNRAYTPADGMMVVQQDVYFATDTRVQLHALLKNVTSDTYTTATEVSLWKLLVKPDNTVAVMDGLGATRDLSITIDRNTWYTITTAIDLVSGKVSVYINGIFCYDFVSAAGTNISVPKCSVVIAKLDSKTTWTTEDFSKGYLGTYAFDNTGVYSSVEEAMASHPGIPDSALFSLENNVEIDMSNNDGAMSKVANTAFVSGRVLPIVYNADYTINTATGTIVSELDGETALTLYSFDLTNGLFCVGENTLSFDKGVSNNVKMVIISAGDTLTADIYLNGIYAGTCTIDSLTANSWSVAKATENGIGSVSISNISAIAYVGSNVNEIELTADTIVFANSGTTSANKNNIAKTYGVSANELTIYSASEYFKTNTLLTTTDYCSVRLDTYETSGLRFATEVNTDLIASMKALGITVAEMGTLITHEKYADPEQDNLGDPTLDGNYEIDKSVLRIVAGEYYGKQIGDDATATHFVGSIVNLIVNENTNNITSDFYGRGYMIVELSNGERYIVYSGHTAVDSVQQQAADTLAEYPDLYDEKSNEYKLLNAYRNGTKPATEE